MKFCTTLIVALIVVSSFAQNVPDREQIVQQITAPTSRFYYPTLFKRYERNDTTLTYDDYYHLYYGYTEQPKYMPLLSTNYADSLSNAFQSDYAFMADKSSRIERYCQAILSVEPFNLRDINVLAFWYTQVGDTTRAAEQTFKINRIVEVIQSTGTGLSEKSPWHIIYQNHGEDLLNLLKVEPGRKIIISKSVEFITCYTPASKKIKGYYFDYSEIYKRKPTYLEALPQERRKLEINPIPKDNTL